MAADETLKILQYIVLTQIRGLGPVKQNALLDSAGIEDCFRMSYEELICADKRKVIGEKSILSFVNQRTDESLWMYAEALLKSAYASEIDIIIRENDLYPRRFRNITEMPILLYIKGELKINDYEHSSGIVGARRCTAEGRERAIQVAEKAVNNNSAVISGMAKGIDAYAHTAALKNRGYTIAVLGNGPDICYPKEHERLYEEIARHGCICSEYPPGRIPREYNFPMRNRIIAALSDELYVIDAGRNSGTETTAEKCRKYGRKLVDYKESQ